MNEQLFRILKRFGKAFLSGGIAQLLIELTTKQFVFSNWNVWLHVFAVAFLTGGLMAVEKALQAEDAI